MKKTLTNIPIFLFPILLFMGCEVKDDKNISNVEKKISTPLKIKKDICSHILMNIEKKAYFKNKKKITISPFLDEKKIKYLMKSERERTINEFECLETDKLYWRDFLYVDKKGGDRVYDTIRSMAFYDKWYYLQSFNVLGKEKGLRYFMTYSFFGGLGGHSQQAIRLFTISPKNQKVADVVTLALYVEEYMTRILKYESKFLNDSVFVRNTNESFRGETTLEETAKFLISNTGEIKLLDHNILINKELP